MRHRILFVALLVLALIFAPPFVNLQRYKGRIANTISASIGREVTFSEVHLQILPQPGLVFSNLSVAEDPSFGAEPMLTSPEMTASLRLSSLWRGRLEIARLSFDSPSLNLARDARGRWNIGGSLQQASTVPAVPTGEALMRGTPRFPYIEASDARVNLKFGLTKQPFSLVEADFSLWLASPHQWQMRLAARPVRTDAYLGDTGRLRAEATFVREHSEPIDDIPFKGTATWENAQLGQATWLLTGDDRGWRGDLAIHAQLQGTPRRLHIESDVAVDRFRRYDIALADPMHMSAHCFAELARTSTADEMHLRVEAAVCSSPVGDGEVLVSGRGSMAEKTYEATLQARDVPLASVMRLYRRGKLNVGDGLSGSGTLSARFTISESSPCVAAEMTLQQAHITDTDKQLDLRIDSTLPLSPVKIKAAKAGALCPFLPALAIELGGKSPLLARLSMSREQARVFVTGSADAEQLLAAVKSFGLVARDYHATGTLDLNAQLAANTHGFQSPQWLGRVQSAELTLPQGITLRHPVMQFQGDKVILSQFSTTLPEIDSDVTGSISWPVRCESSPCPFSFALHATALDVDTLNRAINPRFRSRNWFYLPRFLTGAEAQASPISVLLLFEGSGQLRIDQLSLRKMVIRDVSSQATWEDRHLKLLNASGKSLNGKISGEMDIDFTRGLDAQGRITLTDADLAATAELVGVAWARGHASAAGTLAFSGTQAKEIADSFAAELHFSALNGALRRWSPAGDLRFQTWTGRATFRGRQLTIARSSLDTAQHEMEITGTVDPDLGLDLTARTAASTVKIGGTLLAPLPAAAPNEAASNVHDAPANPEPRR